MNSPVDVTVLSVIEPVLSLPLLLVLEVSGSVFFCGRGGSLPLNASVSAFFCDLGASTGRTGGDDGFGDTGEDTLAKAEGCVEELERRRWWVPDVKASAITLDTEDDDAEAGGRPPELRRGVVVFSKSICFRLGDELDDPGGFSESAAVSRFRCACACSMVDAFGTEVDVPPLLPEPRELLLVMDDATICGLPPRPFVGIGIAADFADDRPEVLFRRSPEEIAGFALGPVLTGLVDGLGLPVPRDERLSSAALTSDGMGTWCTRLTDRQSAGCMRRCSLGAGARQQPGQPALKYPAALGGGLVRAHLQ